MQKIIALALFPILFFVNGIEAKTPIKIGVPLGLTGKFAKMGDMQKKGYELWQEDLNKKGGILGRQVIVIINDDASSVEQAKKIYKEYIVKKSCDFVMGPYSSPLTEAIMPIAEEHQYPVLASGASSDTLWEKGYNYLFGVFIPASRYSVGFLEMIAMKGITNVAIAYADDSFSITIGKGAKKWGKSFGLDVVYYESFEKGKRNLDDITKGIISQNASAVVVCGHYNESVDVLHSFVKANWIPKNYFATVGPTLKTFYTAMKPYSENVFSSSQWEPGVTYNRKDNEIFLKPFVKKYGQEPAYHAALSFAACQLLEIAIKKANSIHRKKIRDVLSDMDAMSIIGRYGVDKRGKQVKHFPLNTQWQNGKKRVVWPEKVADAKPVIRH